MSRQEAEVVDVAQLSEHTLFRSGAQDGPRRGVLHKKTSRALNNFFSSHIVLKTPLESPSGFFSL